MNTKINPILAIGIIVLIAFAFGGSVWWQSEKMQDFQVPSVSVLVPPEENKGVVCTQEAKQCPNGSYVSRTGPNCEFAACPGKIDNQITGNDKDAHGCIGTAGFTWCEEKQKCLRSWEEKCAAE